MSPQIPSGAVTFLFTDIEGSTQLWEKHPEAMPPALARHDLLLRSLCQAAGGYVFKTMGDAFCVAFASPVAALGAAIACQRAIHVEPWGQVLIKVRMALHCGEVESRDNDYFGPPLNRVARLLSAGHGGQVLISTALREKIGAELPVGISLRDMGERRLKDLIRPERIYQLIIPGLPLDFAPLKTLDDVRTNLPAQFSNFIGREKEMAEVKTLLNQNRLVTLTGVGGTGKTRLALQVASNLLDDFPGGVWLVELAPVTHPELVSHTIAAALELHELAGRPPAKAIVDFLEKREVLLLLDNCEHLLQPCAQLAHELLQRCSRLKILTTTREPLGIAGEMIWSVPSFSLPPPDGTLTPHLLGQFDAVRLFLERARAVQPNFELTVENAHAITQICTRLDGIPLALELAAARVRAMSVEQIASRLDSRFRLLTGGSRTALPRQQTLSALVDWSYNLLSETEKLLFQRLAIFIGPFPLESAEQVCGGAEIDELDVLDLLQRLVDKSLVLTDERHGKTYYRLLETIRQYGREKLFSMENAEQVANQHAEYFLRLAKQADHGLRGPEQVDWLRALDTLRDNFRAALEWVIESGQTEKALQMAHSLSWFWFVRSEHNEGRQWLARVAQLPDASHYPVFLADVFADLAHHTWLQLNPESALPLAEEALTIAKTCANREIFARVSTIFHLIRISDKKFTESRAGLSEMKAIFYEIGDEWNYAHAVICLAAVSEQAREVEESLALHQEAYQLFHRLGDSFFQSVCLRVMGALLAHKGDWAAGEAALKAGLNLALELDSKSEISFTLFELANLALAQGGHARAVTLAFASKSLQESMGMWDNLKADAWLEESLEPCRAVLSAVDFQSAAGQGAQMSMARAIEFALR